MIPPEVVGEGNGTMPEDAPLTLIRRIWSQLKKSLATMFQRALPPPHGKGKGRSYDSINGAYLASLYTSNLTLHQIIPPCITWKDYKSLLFEKIWTYIKVDELLSLFYISLDV